MYEIVLFLLQIVFLSLTLPFYLVYLIFLLPGLKKVRKPFVSFVIKVWAKSFLLATRAKLSVIDKRKNTKVNDGICYITNHQSMIDILVIIASLPGPIGFIAKKELLAIPVINLWMMAMGCVFLDRKNLRKSVAAIKKGSENIKNGNNMVIFPEGTRSQGGPHHEFKKGSFHLATDCDSNLIPLTLDGSYKLLEKRSKDRTVILTIHEMIPIAGMSRDEKKLLPERIEKTILDELTSK